MAEVGPAGEARDAQSDAIRLVLVSYAYARLTTGQLPDRRELYAR